MLAYKQCQSCGGIYTPIQADGTRYFHRCPPIPQFYDDTGAPITKDAADGILKLGGKVYRKDVDPPNLRDENVVPNADARKPASIKAEGAGAVDIVPPNDPLAGATLLDGSKPLP